MIDNRKNQEMLDMVFKAMQFTDEDKAKITPEDREKLCEPLIFMAMIYNNPLFADLRQEIRLTFYKYVKEYYLAEHGVDDLTEEQKKELEAKMAEKKDD